MKITDVISHVLQYDMDEELGYSQQYYSRRSAHLVEVRTDEGVVGWGECFGPGTVAIANKAIVERVIAPMVIGEDPANREHLWHKIYNLLRDHGQKGMSMQALSGVDLALWDIAGKITGLPLYKLIGGKCRDRIKVYGYGMMLRRTDRDSVLRAFETEAGALREAGYHAVKMKIGLGPRDDLKLVAAVRRGLGDDIDLMVDANHCYTVSDALYVGKGLEELDVRWFEEPVAPEDLAGYRELREKLTVPIAGGECEFSRWGWRELLAGRCVDIAQPEVCAVGGVSEYLKVLALAHTHFIPVNNHVWGSAISIATNIHLLTAMPPVPGGLYPWEPMLEYDTTPNLFRDELGIGLDPVAIEMRAAGGTIATLEKPGIGVEPDPGVLERYRVC